MTCDQSCGGRAFSKIVKEKQQHSIENRNYFRFRIQNVQRAGGCKGIRKKLADLPLNGNYCFVSLVCRIYRLQNQELCTCGNERWHFFEKFDSRQCMSSLSSSSVGMFGKVSGPFPTVGGVQVTPAHRLVRKWEGKEREEFRLSSFLVPNFRRNDSRDIMKLLRWKSAADASPPSYGWRIGLLTLVTSTL